MSTILQIKDSDEVEHFKRNFKLNPAIKFEHMA